MRRRAGVGAIQRQKIQQNKFKEKGSELQENQLEQVPFLLFVLNSHANWYQYDSILASI